MKGIEKKSVQEVRTLAAPPQLVKDNVLTTLLLLGHYQEETQRYQHARALLKSGGPEAIQTRTAELKVEDVPLNVALGAQSWMKDPNIDRMMKVSAAGCAFLRWNLAVIEAVLSRHSEDEISKTEPRTKFHTDPLPE